MKTREILATLTVLAVLAASPASAGLASSKSAGAKAADVPLPPIVHRVKREAPIVMGRSVAARHKTKLHHIKVNPIESAE